MMIKTEPLEIDMKMPDMMLDWNVDTSPSPYWLILIFQLIILIGVIYKAV